MVHHEVFTEQKIWCPTCKDHHRFLRIPTAARLLEVSRRTIYRHIEDGSVHVFKLGGTGRYRVCSGCLLAQHSKPVQSQIPIANSGTNRNSDVV